jgi:hypothetical protein
MEPNVDLVLDVEVRGGQQLEELFDIPGHLRPEVVVDEVMPVEALKGGGLRSRLGSRLRCGFGWSIQARCLGRRFGQSSSREKDLHP